MAMEIEPKQLHKHAVPIVMITMTLMAVSLVSVYQYQVSSGTESALTRSLLTRTINVKPTPNGLAEVTLNNPTVTPKAGSSLEGSISQAGRSAQISLLFQ